MYNTMMIIWKHIFIAIKKTKQLTSSVVHWPYKVSLSRICFSSTFYIQPNKHRRNRAAVGQTSYHPTWFFSLQLTIINQLPSNGSNLRTLEAWQLVFILTIMNFSLFWIFVILYQASFTLPTFAYIFSDSVEQIINYID